MELDEKRRSKIVCTVGPASRTPEVLGELIDAGMNVARLNFSHGNHQDHAEVIARIRTAADERRRPIAILQDLQGPKIRVGKLLNGPVQIFGGRKLTLTTRSVPGSPELIPTDYEDLPRDVLPGNCILMDDGLMALEVLEVEGTEVHCRVVDGGLLKSRKGINLPGTDVSAPSLTEKDREDLIFGLAQGVDYVALSFVRKPEDVAAVREVMEQENRQVPVIAKLEKPEALERLEAILEVVDGVMIARGDMGVELPPEQVPIAQKRIIQAAYQARVPVITATQMLESMTENPRPTRAEASDVANAIFDGTDATMLSGETASGKHPVETVKMMDRIARTSERNRELNVARNMQVSRSALDFAVATCQGAILTARAVHARAIVAFTRSGSTARIISKLHPPQPIIAFTPDPVVRRQMALLWGVTPCTMRSMDSTDELMKELDTVLLEDGWVGLGETIVIIMGSLRQKAGSTDLLHLHRVGALLT